MRTIVQAAVIVVTTVVLVASSVMLVLVGLAAGAWRFVRRAVAGASTARLLFDSVALVAASIVVTTFLWLHSPLQLSSQSFEFRVEPGAGLASVAIALDESGVVEKPRLLSGWGRLLGYDGSIRAGRYRIDPGTTPHDLLQLLCEGRAVLVSVTVPEGAMLYEIAGIWSRATACDSTSFVALGEDRGFAVEIGVDAPSLEGYLFPETYSVDESTTEKAALKIMVDEFRRRTGPDYEARANSCGYTLNEAVTLASLVEWETGVPQERVLVSAVFTNRLERGMLLQCDPTVVYALRPLERPLRRSDLRVDSPYNTYRYPGLPPGPICSPGAALLEAALSPADVGYLYFVASGNGGHLFAHTNAEHEANKRRARRRTG
jgi:UPF0755 protein